MNEKCNCWVGTLNDYDQSDINNLMLSNIVERLKARSGHSKAMKAFDLAWERYEPKDYLDRRRGLATLFNYCPWCGKKINWTKVRKMVKEEVNKK